jgi:predicted DNA-binding transcriptional regulator AlpA
MRTESKSAFATERRAFEPDNLLNDAETSALLGIRQETLRVWRSKGTPHQPPYIKIGPALVRYRRAALMAWLDQHPTSPSVKRKARAA